MADDDVSLGGVPCAGRLRLKSPHVNAVLEDCWVVVSRNELFIRSEQPIDVGALVRFELTIDADTPLFSGLGRVAWRREEQGEESPGGIGLEMLRMDERSRAVIEEIVGGGGTPLPPPPEQAVIDEWEQRVSDFPPPASPEAEAPQEATEGEPEEQKDGAGVEGGEDEAEGESRTAATPPPAGGSWTRAVARAAGLGPEATGKATPVQQTPAEPLVPEDQWEAGPPGSKVPEPTPDPKPEGATAASERVTAPGPFPAIHVAGAQALTPAGLEAVVTVDGHGRVAAWSPAASKLFRVDLDDVVGKPLTSLMAERLRKDFLSGLGLFMATFDEGRSGRSLETTAVRGDGDEFQAEIAMGKWSAHGKTYWSAVIRDVSGLERRPNAEPVTQDLPPVLDGKYRLLEEIGRGGMGTVYKAEDGSLDRTVAIKFLLPEHQSRPELVERFQREARAMAAVRQHNVLQIFAFGRHRSTDYFVMEYLPGETAQQVLHASLDQGKMLPVADVLWFIDQAAAGLSAVHRSGSVHRDIKPGNLMIQQEPRRAVIMDFGIVRQYLSNDMKRTPEPFGTPTYMAPEIISGAPINTDSEHLTDIYALGVTFFELLTGVLPFSGRNWVEVFQRHLTEPPPAPSSARPGLPEGLDAVVLRCLAKEPTDRYRSAEEIREALLPFMYAESSPLAAATEAHHSSPAPDAPPPPGKEQPRKARRYPGTRVLLADPDPAFRSIVHDCAKEAVPGSRFWSAKGSLAALTMARTAPPIVLVAALDDPDLNGVELAAALSGDDDLAAVQLVLTADKVTPADSAILESMGVRHVLERPVAPDTLSTALRQAAASSA